MPILKIKYPLKHLPKLTSLHLFFINVMFMKLVRFNKFILNTKFVNIV
jgi:hypothetical protein